jgi:hypothetical protein
MRPQDHNRALSIIYGFVGALITLGLTMAAIFARNSGSELYFLPLPLLILFTGYGLFRKRAWARILALIFSALYIWIFPLGTALAIYAWWFLHSEGGRHLYGRDSSTK